jgi:hypothetical protein
MDGLSSGDDREGRQAMTNDTGTTEQLGAPFGLVKTAARRGRVSAGNENGSGRSGSGHD